MPLILSGIHSLDQHISTFLNDPNRYRPSQCPHCGKSRLWLHGVYYRRATCEKGVGTCAPIQRFLCAGCAQTCSVLPEYIPPRRWYHWFVQQIAFQLLMAGHSLLAVCRQLSTLLPNPQTPAPATLYRWRRRCREQFPEQQFHLRSQFPELGNCPDSTAFWRACLDKRSLSQAMFHLHQAGLVIP